jgi:hypothetical protein
VLGSVARRDVYTLLLADDAARMRPGARGTSAYTAEGREFSFGWEARQNAVWRRGRVFLRCPRCYRRCTRLYVPAEEFWLACRRCWGLTYPSRTLQNYKDSLWGRDPIARMLGTSQWALQMTHDNRKERLERSRERWAERTRYFTDTSSPATDTRSTDDGPATKASVSPASRGTCSAIN